MEKIDWQENESVLWTLVPTKEKIHPKKFKCVFVLFWGHDAFLLKRKEQRIVSKPKVNGYLK